MKKKIIDIKLPRTGHVVYTKGVINQKPEQYRIKWHDCSRTTVLKSKIKQDKVWIDGRQYRRYRIVDLKSD